MYTYFEIAKTTAARLSSVSDCSTVSSPHLTTVFIDRNRCVASNVQLISFKNNLQAIASHEAKN